MTSSALSKIKNLFFGMILIGAILTPFSTYAAPQVRPGSPRTMENTEEVEVKKLREQYWSQGKDAEVGVVQNRLYSKKRKFEFSLQAGTLNGDPFLSTTSLGGSLGYYFSEYISAHAVAYKAFSNGSSALDTLINTMGQTANYNKPLSYAGGEARASLLYGKLSLYGAVILYLDAYINLGAGAMSTESGKNLAFTAGIGQQIHISQLFSLNLDYRYTRYSEDILGKTLTNYGQFIQRRSNNSSLVTLGVSIYFNLF